MEATNADQSCLEENLIRLVVINNQSKYNDTITAIPLKSKRKKIIKNLDHVIKFLSFLYSNPGVKSIF